MKRTLLALVIVLAVAIPVAAGSPTMSVTFLNVGQGGSALFFATRPRPENRLLGVLVPSQWQTVTGLAKERSAISLSRPPCFGTV